MNPRISLWPTLTAAQTHADHIGNATVERHGNTYLVVPNGQNGASFANRINGARTSDPDTSHTAGAKDHTGDRALALTIHRNNPDGLTDDELAVLMERRPTSAGKRRLELEQEGLIVRTLQRRPTRAGSPAIVFRAVQQTGHGAA